MDLFDDFERTNSSPSGASEDYFTFLNRADTPFWAEVRRVLEEWFARYPSERKRTLRNDFRSKRRGQHYGAFWELYLHELFNRLGYQVAVHPLLPDSSHQPDFELRTGESRLLVEACVVFSEIVPEAGEVRPPPWLIDAVEHIHNRNFELELIEVVTAGTEQPKVREVANAIDDWLTGLDVDDHAAGAGALSDSAVTFRDWTVLFAAWPRSPEARGTPQRHVLQMGPAEVGGVLDIEQVRATLKGKAGRYGRPTVPLVTAILGAAPFMGRDDIEQALYGREVLHYYQRPAGFRGSLPPPRMVRQRDGFWVRGDGPQNRRVSAVLVAKQLHAASVAEVAPEVWLNPWAHNPVEEPWPFTTITGNARPEFMVADRRPDMAALFGLDASWPGPVAFPGDS
jgi:hypothetical protein